MVKAKSNKKLVIVESPAKARKIGDYLGDEYVVKASMGHVRDLPEKAEQIPKNLKDQKWTRLGVNVESGFEPLYVVPPEKKKVVTELKQALKDCDELIIATDEDREGESIGWHLVQLLDPKVPVRRMVFSEITPEAIQDAIQHTRDVDEHLVEAQETRRVLDRLYGYTLSPLLWKKISKGLSAGRVQSVAVRILVQRELERLAFKSGTYWDLEARLKTPSGDDFNADLWTVDGKRVASGKDFDEHTGRLKEDADVVLLSEEDARNLQQRLQQDEWQVSNLEETPRTRRPAPPFTTSTLQQDANRKLNMSTRETMRVAQRLYEDGVITYMRTDSVHLSDEALGAAKTCVEQVFGNQYAVDQARTFKSSSKAAQEAHEAIRPAGSKWKRPSDSGLSGRELQLYDLIWKRSVATQMKEARQTTQVATIACGNTEFRSSGTRTDFAGFLKAYEEGRDEESVRRQEEERALPPIAENDQLDCQGLEALAHETKPPARYTEASLVKTLEARGVGRPSTYSSIISTIQDRGYVRQTSKQLVPTFTALAVTKLLEQHFPNLVDFDFTAQMEEQLDEIASGDYDRQYYLEHFYCGDEGLDEQVKTKEESIDPREACTLELEGLERNVRVGRFGPFVEERTNGERITASIPEHLAPSDVDDATTEKLIEEKSKGPQPLGMHPEEEEPVYLMNGPFGPYVQLGDVTDERPKPKRVSVPKNLNPDALDLDTALKLLELPRRLGHHPDTGKVVNAGVGRYGPYVVHDKVYKSFDKNTHTYEHEGRTYDVLNVDLDTAVEMLKTAKRRSAPEPLRVLGEHPDDGQPVGVFDGRYGHYVKHNKLNVTIPKDMDWQTVTLEQMLPLIEQKAAQKGKKKSTRKKSTKKKAAKKKATRKKSGKKASKKKAPAKKSAARKTGKKSSGKKKSAKKKSTSGDE